MRPRLLFCGDFSDCLPEANFRVGCTRFGIETAAERLCDGAVLPAVFFRPDEKKIIFSLDRCTSFFVVFCKKDRFFLCGGLM